MVLTYFESALEAEQSSNSDQSFFLKHPVDSQLSLKNQSAARGGGCGVKRRPN